MNNHRSSVKSNGKAQYFYDHYNKAGHSFRDADIRIIDYVEGGDEQMLGDKEDFWIDTLCTAYPLGLNDNIRGEGNISRSNLDQVYFRSPVLRWKRSHGRKKKMGGRRVGGSEDRCTKERMEREIVELKGLLDRSKLEFYRRLKSYSRMFLLLLSREAGGRIGFVFNVIKSFVSSEHRQNSGVNRVKEGEVFNLPFVSGALDYLDVGSVLLV